LSRNKNNGKFRNRSDEILFIDARNMDHLINRRTRAFSAEDIALIAETYHLWRRAGSEKLKTKSEKGISFKEWEEAVLGQRELLLSENKTFHSSLFTIHYHDIKGFCKSASIERVRELDYVLTPGRYVGLAIEDDDFDFKERFSALKAEFEAQLQEETRLNAQITENLGRVKS